MAGHFRYSQYIVSKKQKFPTVRQVGGAPVDNTLPTPVRVAAIIGLVEAGIGVIGAVYSVIHQALNGAAGSLEVASGNAASTVGYGTAAFILITFGGVGVAAFQLLQGKRWGRGLVVMLQLLLLPIAYYMVQGGMWYFAIPVALIALVALSQLFSKPAIDWYTHGRLL